jgi:hypothetical protein
MSLSKPHLGIYIQPLVGLSLIDEVTLLGVLFSIGNHF